MSDVVDELRVGEKIDQGAFRIDAKRALEKLKKSRLADPSHWVLEVLRAAHLSGAKQVTVRTDADDVELSFDGRPFPAAVMKDLLSRALGEDAGAEKEPRHRVLALGVAGALGVGLKSLRVRSGKVSLSIDTQGEVTLAACDESGTAIEARKTFGLKVASALLAGSPEAKAIRLNSRGLHVKLNREKLEPFTRKPLFFEKGLAIDGQCYEELDKSHVEFIVQGVAVRSRVWALPGLNFMLSIRSDDIRRDASGSDVVDDDPDVKQARVTAERLSLEALEERVKKPSDTLRTRVAWRLMHEQYLDARARTLMENMPLFPGPAGERWSVAQLRGLVKTGAPLRVARFNYPKGTYPDPCVLFDAETLGWEPLLPGSKREDVAEYVQRNRRMAENKRMWEAQQPEAPELPERHWLATATIDSPRMKGSVGIEARGSGAYVRLLCEGRFLQQGEVAVLAPLRLRAVVDLQGTIADKQWAEIPNPKFWSAIAGPVEDAYERAVAAALAGPEPSSDAVEHARGLLARKSRDGKAADLPAGVLKAKLFECIGGERISLEELFKEPKWRWASARFPHPPLDGKRVLLVNDVELQLLKPFAGGKLSDVSAQLERELGIRKRMEGPKRKPRLGELVKVTVDSPEMTGEVGIPLIGTSPALQLTLLREGFQLESTSLTARYGPTVACIEHAALSPSSDWSKAVRDAAFARVLEVVKEHERLLIPQLLERHPRFLQMPAGARAFLLHFVEKELEAKDFAELDDVARAVAEAKLLDGADGPTSLAELRPKAQAEGKVWLVQWPLTAAPLKGLPAVAGDGDVCTFIQLGTGITPSEGRVEIERAGARLRFRAQPVHAADFSGAPLHVELEYEGSSCDAVLDEGLEPGASVTLLLEQRHFGSEKLAAGLPMHLTVRVTGLDPADSVDDALRMRLGAAVHVAVQKMLERALEDVDAEGARRALLVALKGRLDRTLPEALAKRLLDLPLFPCTDGVSRATAALDALKRVSFVTRSIDGSPRSGEPVVLALEPDVQHALRRFDRDDVTGSLELELKTRAQYLGRQPVEQVKYEGAALLVRPLYGKLKGEVVLAPEADGCLELYFEKRKLCTLPGALPLPLAAAVSSDSVTPTPDHDSVVRDDKLRNLVSTLVEEADALGAELAAQWPSLRDRPGAAEAALRLCAMLARKKKSRAHPLLALDLLEATDGRRLSVGQLLELRKRKQKIPVSDRTGALLGANPQWVWRQDFLQRQYLEPLELDTKDVTDELERAARVRTRPVVAEVKAPLKSSWRCAIDADEIQGEVALPEKPTRRLLVELYQGRSLLERYESDHPCGAVAAVNFDRLLPNPSWTKAARNAQFRLVLETVERFVEELVAKRLVDPQTDRAWAEAAISWKRSRGPIADVLPSLLVFETLDGKPVSVGAVLAEFDRARRVAVASGDLEASERLVLASSTKTHELLEALGVTVKDVSDELVRQGELETARQSRRLEQLSWPGDALVRVKVSALGIRGELAVPAGDPNVEVTLAKQGVRVAALPKGVAPGIAGVVDIDGLLVDEGWTQARLSPPEREVIDAAVQELLAQLGHVAPSLSRDRKADARRHVLSWLSSAGVTSAPHVDRLTGATAALAKAPVFETVEGEWVSVSVLSDEVRRRGRVAVFTRSLFRPDTGGALGLWAKGLGDDWLEALVKVLGVGTLERVKDASEWRERLREEDPPKGSSELWALSRLRRDVRLLRSGALGELSPEDVEDVRLRPLGGGAPVRYELKRKVVLLDSDHALVKNALSDAKLRRERIYVLLAAMYGAINRALERVTDEHEEALAAALAAHLAANPQLLESSEE